MDVLDEFDIKIIKELEKDGRMAYSANQLENIEYHGHHQHHQ
jgi:DNA-binding Lrp family transcriptional regulator